jgi:Cys-tRNA(Pro)/Cys-tRNA(Cys) deacylase
VAKGANKGGTPAILALERAGVAHSLHPYDVDPDEPNYGRLVAAAIGYDEATVFKTLVAMADGRAVVGVVPVAGSLSLKALAAAVGAKRAEMAAVDVAERLTGYVVGGISPLGQRKQLPTVLDASASSFERIFVSAGRRGLQVGVAPGDLVRLAGATTAAIAAP